jgi:hypothetical protein
MKATQNHAHLGIMDHSIFMAQQTVLDSTDV